MCGVEAGGTINCIGNFRALQDLIITLGDDDGSGAITVAGLMTSVTSHWAHWCGLERGGLVLCWGQRAYGKRGLPFTGYSDQWDLVANVITDPQFTAVTVGASHSCGIAVDGLTYCWGKAAAVGRPSPPTAPPGQCASGPDCVIDPVPLVSLLRFSSIHAGGRHTCGLTDTGDLFCWGDGESGQLGNGTADALAPLKVPLPAPIEMFSAGSEHTCALTTSRQTYCWGSSEALGLGTGAPVANPTLVDTDREFIDLVAGSRHTCARDVDWQVWCWGWNNFGQLGTGDTLTRSRPTGVVLPLAGE